LGVVLRVQTPKMNALLLQRPKSVKKYDQIQCNPRNVTPP